MKKGLYGIILFGASALLLDLASRAACLYGIPSRLADGLIVSLLVMAGFRRALGAYIFRISVILLVVQAGLLALPPALPAAGAIILLFAALLHHLCLFFFRPIRRLGLVRVCFHPVSLLFPGMVLVWHLVRPDISFMTLVAASVSSSAVCGYLSYLVNRLTSRYFAPLVLGSASPRRSQLLSERSIRFIVSVPVNEPATDPSLGAVSNVRSIAAAKALSAGRSLHSGVLVSADTVVVLHGDMIGKPGGTDHAGDILRRLSGTVHTVFTGVVVRSLSSSRMIADHAASTVRMKELDEGTIAAAAREHLDKAGAYAVQEDDRFVETVSGSYSNVVGLPMELLRDMLFCFGVYI